MRKVVSLLFAAIALWSGCASAQIVHVPCQAFGASPFVCVNNQSDYPVAYINCDGFQVRVVSDGGFIPPHQVGVAKFRQGYCTRVNIYTTDGRSRGSSFIDTRNSYIITIPNWRW